MAIFNSYVKLPEGTVKISEEFLVVIHTSITFYQPGGFAIETSHDQYSKWIQVDMG